MAARCECSRLLIAFICFIWLDAYSAHLLTYLNEVDYVVAGESTHVNMKLSSQCVCSFRLFSLGEVNLAFLCQWGI